MRLHGDHAGDDSKKGAGQVKKVIRWPAKFQRPVRGEYCMTAGAAGGVVVVGVYRSVRERWRFSASFYLDGATAILSGYAHTMASAKRCAHRDMMFLLKRAGVKGVF